ncbi:hypothetical protein HaLaN_31409, partial [Haematococcus lacustris]
GPPRPDQPAPGRRVQPWWPGRLWLAHLCGGHRHSLVTPGLYEPGGDRGVLHWQFELGRQRSWHACGRHRRGGHSRRREERHRARGEGAGRSGLWLLLQHHLGAGM